MIDPINGWAIPGRIFTAFAAACGVHTIRADPDRLAGLSDVRKIGSGNISATNVLRTGNKKRHATVLDGPKARLPSTANIYGPDIAIVTAASLLGICPSG